jgi:small redox-active disulfide protein 2
MATQPDSTIQVLGPGCKRCEALAIATRQAVAELGLDATVEKVTDYAQMAPLGVMSTPALAVDGKLVMSGSVPDVARIKLLLAPAA